jgi:hypothetical protein
VKPAEQLAKTASTPTTGLLATLRGLLRAVRTGAPPSSVTPVGSGPRIAVAATCAFVCVLALGASSASAAAPFEFGSFGSETGQMNEPSAVAVDATGDVYVADAANNRVDKFDKSGNFVLAWGAGVADGANELQTCTTTCREGRQSTISGGFVGLQGVAVDPSGDVYAADGTDARVQKFGPEGKFILMFGGNVNATKDGEPSATQAERDLCTATSGDVCTEGQPGTGNGEFSNIFFAFEARRVAVGPGGTVYAGDSGRVEVFQPSGAWKETISIPSLSFEVEGEVFPLKPNSLAVDAIGDIFVAAPNVEGVREVEPNGTEESTQFDKGSTSVTALTLDSSGNLFVGDESGGFHILKYGPAATELQSFGSKTLGGANRGMAYSPTSGELYASEFAKGEEGHSKAGVWVFTPPPAGPLVDSESATPGLRGVATLEAQVNPEGNETTYHFEYVDKTQFEASGYASATTTTPASIEASFEDQTVSAGLSKLVPGETYHWRIVASSSQGTATGADELLEETPPALIDGPWTEDVAATSATLASRINPLGANTSYRLEYGLSTSYEHLLTGNVGEGMSPLAVSRHIQDLEPGLTYHYRLVTINEVGTVQSADHTFTTNSVAGSELGLPDGRAWELVSPASTGGSVLNLRGAGIQAAPDGSAITYPAHGAPLGENVVSNGSVFLGSQVVSRRAPAGWRSLDINAPQSPPTEGSSPGNLISGSNGFPTFSADLTVTVFEPPNFTSLSAEGLEGTPYGRNNTDGSYLPLLTAANTPPGTTLMGEEPPLEGLIPQVRILGGTPEHVILGSWLKLTEEAIPGATKGIRNLYEWSGGLLRLVNILPNSEPSHDADASVYLAGAHGTVARAVSSDGRRVAWTRGTPYQSSGIERTKGLYLRDMVEGKTVQLGGLSALYQTMSSDGSRVFFLENGDLYEYNAGTGAQTDLTASHGAGETSAGVQEMVSDVSEDGSYVYFVATGALAEGGVSGADNLYLLHETGGKWETRHVATLSSADAHSWRSERAGDRAPVIGGVSSRVSPDGRYLTFMSQGSLTGYDSLDANPNAFEHIVGEGAKPEVVMDKEGKPVRAHDEEVYLYDSLTQRLVCASCNPTGARPHGVDTSRPEGLVESLGGEAWGQLSTRGPLHWLAGSLPLWQALPSQDFAYQPRYLSDSGRLFFNSPDALVPQDTNGVEDVYEYEVPGVGGCTTTSVRYSPRSGGCVNLISSGTASTESAFFDASENGDDVFFLTSDHLSVADTDTGYDVWDAHVCSAAAPCQTVTASTPPCSSGDSCKPAPALQPELFGPAPSATFSGVGNVTPAPGVARRPPTRLQQLSKALASCHTRYQHSKKRRAACERTAHKHYRYAAGRAHRAKATKRGGK